MKLHAYRLAVVLSSLAASSLCAAGASERASLATQNGWYIHEGRAVWGNAQHNGWWRAGQRPNLTRNAPGEIRPNRLEDLDKLTDNMLRCGYPAFEHNFGLWYDRRRDRHDVARRDEPKAEPPFLEQPWARSGDGAAWDGLPLYDLTRFNPWYFRRLREFADLCDRKGAILIHNHYMQHALLETSAHYVDFPWRPANCLQETGLPGETPVANAFYDAGHPVRRELHRVYIRKCLDELGGFRNVIWLPSEEYTGPLSFIEFWLDSVREWERENGRDIHVGVGACKDVLDALLADPERSSQVDTIDLRYWWYRADGSLDAPPGGREVPGRFAPAKTTSPEQLYRQVREVRDRHPDKGIITSLEASREETWAFLMAGGSLLVRRLEYEGHRDPPEYEPPEHSAIIQPLYDFIRGHLASSLPRMRPADIVREASAPVWCLADPGREYLVYGPSGGSFDLDLSAASGRLRARWLDPATGELTDLDGGEVEGGRAVSLRFPGAADGALWLHGAGEERAERTAVRIDEALRSRGHALRRRGALMTGLEMHEKAPAASPASRAAGPLRVHPDNPRYFADSSGRAILLVGAHTWNNLVDMGPSDPPPAFDFDGYLDWMEERGHNFIRLWTWELSTWDTAGNGPAHRKERPHVSAPQPFLRAGPGLAIDGKPRFDLRRYDPEYFRRLRTRVKAAGERGIYVSVMLFEGWGLQFAPGAWEAHPFHPRNNSSGVDGDLDGDGKGIEIHTLKSPEITAIQEAYVRKVIETVNDLDNVLFEISNENHPPSTEWQYHMIEFIHGLEKSMPQQHPVGMTFQYRGGENRALFASPAEWISPNHEGGYRDNPPPADGRKVILTDTDHLWGIGGDAQWVWKSFLRGLNPIFMDPYDGLVLGRDADPRWEPIRRALGRARRISERIDLARTTPRADLASSRYCLARDGLEYLLYLPSGGEVKVDLRKASGAMDLEWIDPASGESVEKGSAEGGAERMFRSPLENDALLWIRARARENSGKEKERS